MTKIFAYASRTKIQEIKKLISNYWVTKSKKKHILVRDSRVFDWLYLIKNKYSFFYTEDKKKCNGFLGFVQNSKFSNKLKKNDI